MPAMLFFSIQAKSFAGMARSYTSTWRRVAQRSYPAR